MSSDEKDKPGNGQQKDFLDTVDDPTENFRCLLKNGEIENALKWQLEWKIHKKEVVLITKEVFDGLIEVENYNTALKIGLQYQFESSLVDPLYLAEWKRLFKNEDYEDAAKWASERPLPVIHIMRAAVKAYEKCLIQGRAEDAIRLIKTYNLDKNNLLELTLNEFNKAFKQTDYLKAAVLGKEFHFSEKRTIQANVYAAENAYKAADFALAIDIITKNKLITDEIFNLLPPEDTISFINVLIDEFLHPLFEEGKLIILQSFADKTNLLKISVNNKMILKLRNAFIAVAVKQHNILLNSEEVNKAKFILKTFNLFDSAVSPAYILSIVETAIKYHKNLLENGDLKTAIEIKDEYCLLTLDLLKDRQESIIEDAALFVVKAMGERDFESVILIIKEYNILSDLINDAVFDGIYELLKSKDYTEIMNVFESFRPDISDPVVLKNVLTIFSIFMKAKKFIYAADLALNLGLDNKNVENASFNAWREKILLREFIEALDIKDKYNIPKARIFKYAEKKYRNFIKRKDYRSAALIRRQYEISLTFYEWLMEIFNLIFSGKFWR